MGQLENRIESESTRGCQLLPRRRETRNRMLSDLPSTARRAPPTAPPSLLTPVRSGTYSLLPPVFEPAYFGNSPLFGSGDTQRPKRPPAGEAIVYGPTIIYPTERPPRGFDDTGHFRVRTK